MATSDNINQQGYTNRKWCKEDLENLWHSLFDYDGLSRCRQDDAELMSAAILLKKTFQLFKDVKQRCAHAEEACAKQEECPNCVKLLQENEKQKERLEEMEVRHKAVGRLLNLFGSVEDGSQLLRNSQQVEALTQAFLGAPERRLRGVKRQRGLLDDGGVPETLPQERRHTAPRNIVIPETLDLNHICTMTDPYPEGEICDVIEISTMTPRQTLDKCLDSPEAGRQILNIADLDVTQTPNVQYTKLTPEEQCSPEERPPKSPVIGSSSLSKKSRSFRRAAKLTQSTQESSLRCVPDVNKLNESGISSLNRLAMIVGTPKIIETPPESRPSPVSPNCAGGTFDISLDESPSVISNPGFGRGVLKTSKNKVKENIMDRSNNSQLQESVACVQGMKESQVSGAGKVKPAERKQADYWQLKPTTSVQSLSITGKESKLKQTKLSLGVFPKRTDLCSLTGFNGGIRLSQSPSTKALDNASTRASDEKIAADLLEGLKDSDFLSPSPKVAGSVPRGINGSQASKAIRKCLMMDEVNGQTFYEPPQTKKNTYSNDNIPHAIEKLGARTSLLRDSAILPIVKGNSSDLPLGKLCTNAVLLQPNVLQTQENVEDLLRQMEFPETPRTKELVQNFDKIPNKSKNEPHFKYRGDVVRKKEDRMKLQGWDCYECQDFFEGREDDAAKQKALMNQCSRHRDKNQPTKSPEGYWDAGFPSTQECRERNLNITQSGKPLRSRRKKD